MTSLPDLISNYHSAAKAWRTIEHGTDNGAFTAERNRLQGVMAATLDQIRQHDGPTDAAARELAAALEEEHNLVHAMGARPTFPPGVPAYQARQEHELYLAATNARLETLRDTIAALRNIA